MKRKEFDYELVYQLYNISGETITNIAKILGTNRLTITKWLKRNNFEIDSKRKKTNKIITLSVEQEEILYGGLLGDCCLSNNGKRNTNTQISYISSKKDHVEFFKSFFEQFSGNDIIETSYLDKRTNKFYTSYRFRSSLNVGLNEYREKWYVDGVKIIPIDLKLTPKICLMWYLGDGSIQQCYSENRTDLIKLSTNCFNEKDVDEILIPQLSYFFAYKVLNEKNQPIIKIPRKYVKKFLDYIGECPVESYKYKWDVFEYKYNKYKKDEIR